MAFSGLNTLDVMFHIIKVVNKAEMSLGQHLHLALTGYLYPDKEKGMLI